MEKLLLKVKQSNGSIRVDNGNLKVEFPKGVDASGIIEEIRSKKAELIAFISEREQLTNVFKTIEKATQKPYYALSSAQRRMYFLYEFDKDSLAYNLPQVLQLNGALDRQTLEQALQQLIERHESLRTSFEIVKGEVVQKVNTDVKFEIAYFKPASSQIQEVIKNFISPFDLAKAPLIRVGLISLSVESHLLMYDMHHIVTDATSKGILINDFMSLYNHETLPEVVLQYKDYSEWQQNKVGQSKLTTQKQYWLDEFEDEVTPLDLPTDFPRPSVMGQSGGSLDFEIGKEQTELLRLIGEKAGATMFMTILSVFNVLLSKLSNQEDITIGTPVSGRSHENLEGIIGMFVNTLTLRNYPKGNLSAEEFLMEVKAKCLSCFDNQSYQYEELIEELKLVRDPGRNPLFDVVFAFQSVDVDEEINMPGLRITPYDSGHVVSKFDLTLRASEFKDRLALNIEYSKELYTEETIQRFASYFQRIVDEITKDPTAKLSSFNILSPDAERASLNSLDNTNVSYPREKTIIDLFESQVNQYPDKVAVQFEEQTLTYKELDERSGQLANLLRQEGVNRNVIVALLMDRSLDTIIGMLAILKAGGAYLPIDVDYPPERIDYLLDNSGTGIILTTRSVQIDFSNRQIATLFVEDAGESSQKLKNINDPSDLCYIIYTSGTTGNPKGVMVEHRNVVRLFFNEEFQFDFGSEDTWTLFHSHTFDFSVWEMYGALLFGGRLIVVPKMVARDPRQYLHLLQDQKVTVLNQTPGAFYNLIDEQIGNRSLFKDIGLRYVIFGGEALSPARLKDWKDQYPTTKLVNMFGITETTVHVTYKEITEHEIVHNIGAIGTPIPTLSVYLFDKYMNLVPPGVKGELCVGGAGVARGYLNNEKLTEAKFVTNPYRPEERLYKSGDMGRILKNGELEYLGRQDQQVKIRGFRIELGEIENQLINHPEVKKAVVIIKQNETNKYLAAYYVADIELSLAAMRSYLSERLPDYMLPAFYVQMDNIPLTANGKINRKALPDPEFIVGDAYVAPENDIQQQLVEIWVEALNLEKVGIRDNFFAVGGDSIRAISLISNVNDVFRTNLRVADIFAHQTIEELAIHIPLQQETNDADTATADMLHSFAELKKKILADIPLDDQELIEDVYPMSEIQKGMVFHALKAVESGVYHDQMSSVGKMRNFDPDLFRKVLGLMIEKHSMLRTSFLVDNSEQCVQMIYRQIEIDFKYHEIAHLKDKEQQAFIENDLIEDKANPFDLKKPGLWRYKVYALGKDNYASSFIFHHAILDGWSNASLTTELNNTYLKLLEDDGFIPAPLKSSYRDYIVEQQLSLKDDDTIEFWKEELSDYIRYSFADVEKEEKYNVLEYEFPPEFYTELSDYARTNNVSIKAVCYAAFLRCLDLFSYTSDITTGLITSNRPVREDGEKILGCFLNTIPFRFQVKKDGTWTDLVREVHHKVNALKSYDHTSLGNILKIIGESTSNEDPITDVIFNYIDFHVYDQAEVADQNEVDPGNQHEGSNLEKFGFERTNSKFSFSMSTTLGSVSYSISYLTTFASEKYSHNFQKYFNSTLRNIVEIPKQIISKDEIIAEDTRNQLLEQFNNTRTNYETGLTVVDLFESQVESCPDAIALKFENETLSYSAFHAKVDQMVSLLLKKGVKQGDIVGIMSDRSIDLMVAIYGVLKLGAGYLPIDPKYPQARIDYIVADSAIKQLLISNELARIVNSEVELIELNSYTHETVKTKFDSQAKVTGLAYVIYTSGSTGKPKGVAIKHSSLYNYTSFAMETYMRGESLPMALFSSISFDLTVTSIFLSLSTGNTLHIYEAESQDLLLQKLFESKEAKMIKLTPAHLKVLVESEIELNGIKRLIVGGDVFEKNLAAKVCCLANDQVELYNEYGPTEATVGCVVYKYDSTHQFVGSSLSIGKPISNTFIYVLDSTHGMQPVGVPGELCIGGEGLAQGYLNQEELSKEKFITNPVTGKGQIYKTGDLARWLPDGNLEFLGRIDDQVKIKGFRIELAEVRNQLVSHSNVKEASVIVSEKDAQKYLVAYYASEKPIDATILQRHLLDQLPEYMLPDYYVHMDNLPLTSNGKLDKRALPDIELSLDNNYTAPRTETEKLLCQVWAKVLGVESVGITDNFFAAGGDSIKSIQISSRMRGLGYEITVNDIFNNPSIQALATRVKPSGKISDQSSVVGNIPLTGIQHWFFNRDLHANHHYNQAVMLNFSDRISAEEVREIFTQLQIHHDALRITFKSENNLRHQVNKDVDHPLEITAKDLRQNEAPENTLLNLCNNLQSEIDLESGPLMKLGLFEMVDGTRLLIVIHHLIIDGVSWRILFEDIGTLYHQVKSKSPLRLPLKSDSFKLWSEKIHEYILSENFEKANEYWSSITQQPVVQIDRLNAQGSNTLQDIASVEFELDEDATRQLLTQVHNAFGTQITDILLAALMMAVNKEYGEGALKVDLEGHGREDILDDINVSRTIGWFTSIYPVMLQPVDGGLATVIKATKETLRSIPNNGVDYLMSQFLRPDASGIEESKTNNFLVFNYLGQFDSDIQNDVFSIAPEPTGNLMSPKEKRGYDWDLSGMISAGKLRMSLSFSQEQYDKGSIKTLMHSYEECLVEVVEFCADYGKTELTPSDLTYKDLTIPQLDELQRNYALEDVYPLSPMQEGMLFHALLDSEADHYFEQMSYCLKGDVDVKAMERGLQSLVERYDILRTIFLHSGYDRSLQVVLKERDITFNYYDVRDEVNESTRKATLDKYKDRDRNKKFDLNSDALMRGSVYRTGEKEYEFVWSHHHILMDGWCMSIIFHEFSTLYNAYRVGAQVELPQVQPYSNYISWLEDRDARISESYWKHYLEGYDSLSTLPKKSYLDSKAATSKARTTLTLTKSETKSLNQISRKYGVTLNTIIQSVWGVLLARYNNVNDVVFGAVVSGRPSDIEGIETMVGLFINTIPVRISFSENDRFGDLLREVQRNGIQGEPHHYNPLSDIQAASELGMGLLDHILIFENYPVADEIEGMEQEDVSDANYSITGVEAFEQTNYDLSIMAVPGDELNVIFDYNTHIYESFMVDGVKRHLGNIIRHLILDNELPLSSIDMLSEEESHELLYQFNDTTREYPKGKTVIELFDEQASRKPDGVALCFEGAELTYGDFQKKVNGMAAALIRQGVEPGDIVGIVSDRSLDMVVGIFGVLKAGGAYLPIDPTYPTGRISYILEDSGVQRVLVASKWKDKMDNSVELMVLETCSISTNNIESVEDKSGSEGLAYVIYTSGSTGRPKGVMIQHDALMNRLHWMGSQYPIGEEDVILQKTPIVFDVSVWELFWWSQQGASLTLLSPGAEKDPELLCKAIATQKITTMHFVPSMLQAFLEYIENNENQADLCSLRQVFSSGEALKANQVASFNGLLHHDNGTRLINLYGPTEATIDVSYYNCFDQSSNQIIPIGKPIDNINLYVLSRSNEVQPIGVPGELCIGGVGLASGYLNNELLTEEKFIKHPFKDNERLYKTGDLARWLPDGNIEYLGRIDHQVKIRGFRIELGEIEGQMICHSQIKETVVVPKGPEGDKFLVGYYVASEEIPQVELHKYLSHQLPEYMVPTSYVWMEELPLTSNGKVDRKSLPDPEFSSGEDYVAPSNVIEQQLIKIWSEVLNIEEKVISTNKSFFELGGHSLKATAVVNKISKVFGVSVPLAKVFTHENIQSLSMLIEASDSADYASISKAPAKDRYVLSSAQRRLYFIYEFDRTSLAYNMPQVVKLEGELDVGSLEETFKKLITHHESLRTSFEVIGSEVFQSVGSNLDFSLEYQESEESNVQSIIKEFVRPFDLSKGPLLRAGLVKIASDTHILMVDMHHIISDGVSEAILIKDFMALYNKEELSEITLEYKDYAEWQQQESQQRRLETQRQFWMNQFEGEVSILNLPTDFERPVVKGEVGSSLDFSISKKQTQELRQVGERVGATMYMTLLTIFNVLLSKLSNQDDIVVGTPVAGRDHADLEKVMGMFVNTLALRNYPKENMSFEAFLLDVKKRSLDCFDNQSYPFEELIDSLRVTRDTSRNPLFDTMFIFQNFEQEELVMPGLTLKPYIKDSLNIAKFDLRLGAAEIQGELYVNLEYSTELFVEETASRFVNYFKHIVNAVIQNPTAKLAEIEVIPKAEKNQILREFNETTSDFSLDKTIIDLFEERVEKSAEAIALVIGEERISYKDLNNQANFIATLIRGKLKKEHSKIALLFNSSCEMIVSILGVLKSGCTYVPLSPAAPADRNDYILKDSNAALLLIQEELKGALDQLGIKEEKTITVRSTEFTMDRIDNPGRTTSPEDLIYSIYTSGTSGMPKGVEIKHKGVVNYTLWRTSNYGLCEKDATLQLLSYHFDGYTSNLFSSLISGGSLVLLPEDKVLDAVHILKVMHDERITHSSMTPGIYGLILDGLAEGDGLPLFRTLVLAGEKASEELIKRSESKLPDLLLINEYGPTETSVCATYNKGLDAANTKIIGTPISNTTIYILDKTDRAVPIGVTGEICISGAGIAKGYINNEELTTQKFATNPFEGSERMYKTGDLGRWLPNGTIEYQGRVDEQVKIRGYRIELKEIESHLSSHPDIKESVVTVNEDRGDKHLVAYYEGNIELGITSLRAHLLEKMPDYMLPSYYVHMAELPLTATGKIDHKALPKPEIKVGDDYVAPSNEIEERLVKVWSVVLKIEEEKISVHANFFDLGGNSLKIIEMNRLVNKEIGCDISVANIFRLASISTMADFILKGDVQIDEIHKELDSRDEVLDLLGEGGLDMRED